MPVYFFRHLPKIFLAGDYVIINLFFILGKLYFFDSYNSHILFNIDYKAQFVILNFSWFIITRLTKLYADYAFTESSLQFNALTKSFVLFVVFFIIYLSILFSAKTNYYTGDIIYFLLVGGFMTLTRFCLFLYRKKNRIKIGRNLYSFGTILVGENKFSKSLLSNDDLRRSIGIKGIYTLKSHITDHHKYFGGTDKLIKDIENVKIDNIIFCDNNIDLDLYKQIVEIAEQKMIRIYMVPDFKYAGLGPFYFDMINEIPFLKLMKEPLSNPKKQFLKRIFDLGFSTIIIVFLLSWLIPIVALIIKLESKGPAFFVQKRSGYKNLSFNCFKFRSMVMNEDADLQTTKKNDSRITKFGAFMRKTSIDELPQFINVFLGEMSVVGPRPHMLSQTEQYSKITKKYMLRHMIKPGITGWAQVMGSRGEIFSDRDMEKRIEKDIWYIY